MKGFSTITGALGGLTLLALAGCIVLGLALLLPAGRARLRAGLGGARRHVLAWAWVVALVAMAGSLWLSEAAHLPPCVLCWYQRIAMYPLVFVLGAALVAGDPGVWRFALPLPLVGLIVSSYHVAMQYRPAINVVACDSGVPCTARLLNLFGFVSIPVMAGAAFLLIALLLATLAVTRTDVAA